jgi:hypothetical protein
MEFQMAKSLMWKILQAGDMVVGYDGKPVSVLQKHSYKEDPKNTF